MNFLRNSITKKIENKFRNLLDKKAREDSRINKELERIAKLPPKTSFETKIFGPSFYGLDKGSFLYMYKEIMRDRIYEFNNSVENPFIIDGGANIGLASLFFARNYPGAEIIAFEADPAVAVVCEKNLKALNLNSVRLIKKALWKEITKLNFETEGADAGKLSTESNNNLLVSTDMLSKYIDKPVDMLKLDIEGAEVEVLNDIILKLKHIKNVFIEYHSFINKEQKLEWILTILKDNGFRYVLNTPSIKNKTPLKSRLDFMGMDFYINIFGTRNND